PEPVFSSCLPPVKKFAFSSIACSGGFVYCEKTKKAESFSPAQGGKNLSAFGSLPSRTALELELEIVRDHGDEFRVGRFAAGVADGVAEEGVEHIDISAVPGDLDGVADGALDPAGGGVVHLGDGGIEELGHRVDHVVVPDRQQDAVAQVVVAFDVDGDADLVDDVGQHHIQVGLADGLHRRRIQVVC